MINGYITLDLTKDNVYTQATACLNSDKPVLIYDGSKSFYASYIAIDDDTETITVIASNTSITITNANVVTATDTTPHLYRVDFELTFDNTNEDTQYIYGNILTSTNYETFTIDDLITEIGNKKLSVSSTVSAVTTDLIVSETTLLCAIYVYNDTLTGVSIDDTGEIELTDVALSNSTITQIF